VHGGGEAVADQDADEIADLLFVREIDRRRRAVGAAEDVAQVDRLAEMRAPPVRRADSRIGSPSAAKPTRAILRQSGIRPTPPMVGVGRMPLPLVSL
jgi:hypothetical protein